ncbi:MAG: hypothetical protein AVO33_11345 [delta proteobacterium ML8_F1]|nr:MAG: hypothetical protein AVO33_11345 [delta proteobacterium ML8_F1]
MTDYFDRIKKSVIVLVIGCLFLASLLIVAMDRLDLLQELEAFFGSDEKPVTLISRDTKWSYIQEGENPSVGNVWAIEKYDKTFWKTGIGDFGSGTDQDVTTPLRLEKENGESIASYFFRYDVFVQAEDYEGAKGLQGLIEYNDAAVIYLNGELVFAGNVPENAYASNQEYGASERVSGIRRDEFFITDLSPLKSGINVIGVQVHQYDSKSEDIYFNLSALNLLKTDIVEEETDLEPLVVEVGNSEEDINFTWTTEAGGYYQVEYMDSKDFKSEKDFDKRASVAVMARRQMEENRLFLHRVNIARLKSDTRYAYRVRRIGSEEPSSIGYFTTGQKGVFTCAVIKDLQQTGPEKSARLVAEVDFIITPVGIDSGDSHPENLLRAFEDWRALEILKEMPVWPVEGSLQDSLKGQSYYRQLYQRETADGLGNSYVVYQDVLLVYLKPGTGAADFVAQALQRHRQKRVIVLGDQEVLDSVKALTAFEIDGWIDLGQGDMVVDVDYRSIVTRPF